MRTGTATTDLFASRLGVNISPTIPTIPTSRVRVHVVVSISALISPPPQTTPETSADKAPTMDGTPADETSTSLASTSSTQPASVSLNLAAARSTSDSPFQSPTLASTSETPAPASALVSGDNSTQNVPGAHTNTTATLVDVPAPQNVLARTLVTPTAGSALEPPIGHVVSDPALTIASNNTANSQVATESASTSETPETSARAKRTRKAPMEETPKKAKKVTSK